MKLYNLIADCREYMEYFNRNQYVAWFEKYLEMTKPVLEATDDERAAAVELLDALDSEWNKLSFSSKRKALKERDKLVICCFLNPALVKADEDKGQRLADAIREEWITRWPKDQYKIGTYEFIMKGFRPRLFGFLLNRDGDE